MGPTAKEQKTHLCLWSKNTDMQTFQISFYVFIVWWNSSSSFFVLFAKPHFIIIRTIVWHRRHGYMNSLQHDSQPQRNMRSSEASETGGLAWILFALYFPSIRSYLISHTRPLNSFHFSSFFFLPPLSQEHSSREKKKKRKSKRRKSYPPRQNFSLAELLWTCVFVFSGALAHFVP